MRFVQPWVMMLLATTAGTSSAGPVFDWSSAQPLSPGVLYFNYVTESPRLLNINIVRIDTFTPRLRFLTTGPRPDWVSNVSETNKQSTRQWITQSQLTDRPLTLAINASPWGPFPAADDVPANIVGLAVADGVLVSPAQNNRPAFIIDDAGVPRIQVASTSIDITQIDQAAVGFGIVLTNGVPIASTGSLEPRTGYGISADQRYVYFMTIDGRRYSSQGTTIGEVGQWLQFFGASSGINMDGGGSTTLARWDSTSQSAVLLNLPNPLNLFIPDDLAGSQAVEQLAISSGLLPIERAVANNFGIYYEAIPEAGTIRLLCIGFAGLGYVVWRSRPGASF
jgi:hypothetical protein